MPDRTSIPAEFPLQGIDVTVPYDQQPKKTTPSGVNVRARDPILSRYRGGSRPGLAPFGFQVPGGDAKIQSLGILVSLNVNNVISTWDFADDYVDDPRNAARKIPPHGNGETPVFGWPPVGATAYRRQNLTASALTAVNGTTVTLTGTTTNQSGGSFVSGGLVKLSTTPVGRDGSGDTGTTNASGVTTFTVSEASFTGPVTYYAGHQYTRAGQPLPSTARGYVTVRWTPASTLTLESPQGASFEADGKSHPLLATLTRIATSKGISGQKLILDTDVAAPGKGQLRYTNGSGKATFAVSNTDVETVEYTVSLAAGGLTSDPVSVDWTVSPPPPPVPPVPPVVCEWIVDSKTPVGGGDYLYGVTAWKDGVPDPFTSFTQVASGIQDILCCVPAFRFFGGPGNPALFPPLHCTMHGDICPDTVPANTAYANANCHP